MAKGRLALVVLSVMIWSAVSGIGTAWEIALTDGLVTRAAVVRLADIAVIHGVDDVVLKQDLASVIVAPGPTRSHARELSSSDVRRKVEQLGVDMSQGRFTGASRVLVTYGEPAAVVPAKPSRGLGTPTHRLQRELERVSQIHATASAERPATEKNAAPATGQPVVVAVRELRKGQLIRKDDVTLMHVAEQDLPSGAVASIEDAVGYQADGPIRVNEPLTDRMLKKPLLVRSRDQVMVGVNTGGIFVTVHAIAQNDGGLGDTVQVTPVNDKKTRLYAQVVGVRKVVVMADSLAAVDGLE